MKKLFQKKKGCIGIKDADGGVLCEIICVEPEGKLILEDDGQKKKRIYV